MSQARPRALCRSKDHTRAMIRGRSPRPGLTSAGLPIISNLENVTGGNKTVYLSWGGRVSGPGRSHHPIFPKHWSLVPEGVSRGEFETSHCWRTPWATWFCGRQEARGDQMSPKWRKEDCCFCQLSAVPRGVGTLSRPLGQADGERAHQGRSGLLQSLFESLGLEGTASAACLECYQDDEIAPRG